MLPHFYNRERELMFLNKIYKDDKFNLVVIYGRRRIGKTKLIEKFLEDKKGIYFLATDESIKENLKTLKKKFYEFTNKEFFLKLETEDFYDLFKIFSKEIKKKKCIIAIDEFPYLMTTKKGILSLFQKIIDEILSKTNILLILCGSSMSVMESEVLGHKTPLYGRNVNRWKLLPFSLKVIKKLFKDFFNVYFVFGNVPYYLKFYDENKNLSMNITENLLTKGRNLYDEPLILLRQEFRESRIYRLILKYISLGYKTIGKLCSIIGMDKSNLIKYLSSLEEVGIIRHILPLGMKRKGIYEIKDNLFRFWFRFIYPYRDLLEIGRTEIVENNIKKNISAYFGLCFEYLIEEMLKNKIIKQLEDFNYIYKWWHKDKEIDILAVNEHKKQILACECKWQSKVNPKKTCKELINKLSYVNWHKEKRKEYFCIFAKSFTKKIKEFNNKKVYCFNLKDLKKILK